MIETKEISKYTVIVKAMSRPKAAMIQSIALNIYSRFNNWSFQRCMKEANFFYEVVGNV